MKNKLGIIIFIISFFSLDATIGYLKKKDIVTDNKNDIEEIRAVYISYLEYLDNFCGNSKSINEKKIDKMIDNLQESKFNVILLHVSPFSDVIYPSKLFPYSYTLTGQEGKNPGIDYLSYFIQRAHLKKIQVYAWINPYRISFQQNKDNISQGNPAYQLLNTSSVCIDANGIYYNPASEIVKNLILRQIEEILDNYNVDGIHLDDYFYLQKKVDELEYSEYLKNNGQMSLEDFRLYHTNDLIKRIYKTIKSKKNIPFSIAPDGNINNNYLYHYADVKTWLKNSGYVDIIMPQIYYGFNNQYSPFENVLNSWIALRENENIKIVPVLAFYKSGLEDSGAGRGILEWQNNNNLIARQVTMLREKKLSGYALFRYDFLYDNSKMNNISVNEMANLRKIN